MSTYSANIVIYLISLALASVLTFFVWKGRKRPMLLVFLQAAFEFTGLGVLTFYIANRALDLLHSPDLGSVFLGLAAALVLVMLVTDKVIKYRMPIYLPIAHLAAETIGIILVLLYI